MCIRDRDALLDGRHWTSGSSRVVSERTQSPHDRSVGSKSRDVFGELQSASDRAEAASTCFQRLPE
eukprot:1404143-Alexandrium_andersonii.AAC.1